MINFKYHFTILLTLVFILILIICLLSFYFVTSKELSKAVPKKLIEINNSEITTPGMITNQGAVEMCSWPDCNIFPQEATEGSPNPKKDKLASIKTASAICNVEFVKTGLIPLGTICLNNIFNLLVPATSLA